MYKESFPSRLKKARLDTGFTQREVAEETKIRDTLISRYENGIIEPNIENLGILADFYGVSTDWLIGTTREYVARPYKRKNVPAQEGAQDSMRPAI